MKKEYYSILIGLLLILQIFSFFKINALRDDLEMTTENMHNIEDYVSAEITDLYKDVSQKLEDEASPILSCSTHIGEFNEDTLTTPITFNISPKEVTDTLTVSLDFNGELILLEKTGIIYSTTKNFSISEQIYPTIILEDKGHKTLAEDSGLRVSYLRDTVFPSITTSLSDEISYSSNKYQTKGDLRVKYHPSHNNTSFKDVAYIVTIDNEVIEEHPIIFGTYDKPDRSINISIDENHSLRKGQTLKLSIVAIDSLGFTHEYLIDQFVAGSDPRDLTLIHQKITAPNGEIVYIED